MPSARTRDHRSHASADGGTRNAPARLLSAARAAGAASIGIGSLLLNPLFVAPVIAVAALVARAAGRKAVTASIAPDPYR